MSTETLTSSPVVIDSSNHSEIENSGGSTPSNIAHSTTSASSRINSFDDSDEDEFQWLHPQAACASTDTSSPESHDFRTAPLISRGAFVRHKEVFPQKGLLGTVNKQGASSGVEEVPRDPRIYMNTSTPFSGLVVGVQGSGKSHTISVMLENFLLSNLQPSNLPSPFAGLVLHYDTVAEGMASRPCEAAYLSCPRTKGGPNAEVVVLVPPKNLNAMRQLYSCVPGATVAPLHFDANALSANRMLSLMGWDGTEKMPLYMTAALSILRDMGVDGYSYAEFRRRLDQQSSDFNHAQNAMLKIRMNVLESFVSKNNQPGPSAYFKPGRLVIVDLTDPFLDGQTASLIFDICLGLFVSKELEEGSGKVVVLDEAHKYLQASETSSRLTQTVLALIRQQRHYGLRVLISTQEPTVVPPQILDLVTMIIMHRFSSPAWYHHLQQHVAIPITSANEGWLSLVLRLRLGEGLVYCPAALTAFENSDSGMDYVVAPDLDSDVSAIGPGYFLIHSRMRATKDGGTSRMAFGHHRSGLEAREQLSDTNSQPRSREATTTIELKDIQTIIDGEMSENPPSNSCKDHPTASVAAQNSNPNPARDPMTSQSSPPVIATVPNPPSSLSAARPQQATTTPKVPTITKPSTSIAKPSATPSVDPGPGIPKRFLALRKAIKALQAQQKEPSWNLVAETLVDQDPYVYCDLEYGRFKTYVKAAIEAGVLRNPGELKGDHSSKLLYLV